MISAFPLSWPETFPRAKYRETGQFRATIAGALKNVETSLRLFAKDSNKPISGLVISSNVTLGANRPDDPGVAVWFSWDGMQVCIPVDRYKTVEANLQAIHHVLEARRTELRHGTLALVRATFQGFKALPPPTSAKHWTEVLSIAAGASEAEINQAYRTKAATAHPDRGGSNEAMAALNDARVKALQEKANG